MPEGRGQRAPWPRVAPDAVPEGRGQRASWPQVGPDAGVQSGAVVPGGCCGRQGGARAHGAGRQASTLRSWPGAGPGEAPFCPRPSSQREVPLPVLTEPSAQHTCVPQAHPAPVCSQPPRVSLPAGECTWPHTATHNHTGTHMATHNRTQPHTTTHGHTQPHTATHNHTWPHMDTHSHT